MLSKCKHGTKLFPKLYIGWGCWRQSHISEVPSLTLVDSFNRIRLLYFSRSHQPQVIMSLTLGSKCQPVLLLEYSSLSSGMLVSDSLCTSRVRRQKPPAYLVRGSHARSASNTTIPTSPISAILIFSPTTRALVTVPTLHSFLLVPSNCYRPHITSIKATAFSIHCRYFHSL